MAVYFAASHIGSPNLSRTSFATETCGRMTLSSRFPSNLCKEKYDIARHFRLTRHIGVVLPINARLIHSRHGLDTTDAETRGIVIKRTRMVEPTPITHAHSTLGTYT